MPHPAAAYDALARTALLALLRREHAVVWPEVEAKLAERPHHLPGGQAIQGIDPHHLTNAKRLLLDQGAIDQIKEPTRGGGAPAVLVLHDRRGRKTATDRAAARKRLLQARYLSWTRESKTGNIPNLVGDAGELVLRASLKAAAAQGVGYSLVPRAKGGIATLFGQPVPGGALDDAAYLIAPPVADQGPLALTILFEVKNVRHWIYPGNWELFQLLDKAAQLQLRHPEQGFVPILVCRRAQHTAFLLAKALGFFIYYTLHQPLLPHSSITPEAVQEVNDELGYNLVLGTEAHAKLVEVLCTNLPARARAAAARWSQSAPTVARYAPTLRDSGLLERDPEGYERLMDGFRAAIAAIPALQGS